MTRSQTNTAVRPAQADSKLNGVAKASTERVAKFVEGAQRAGLPPMYASAELIQAAVVVLRGAGYEFDGIPNFIKGCADVACQTIEGEQTRLEGAALKTQHAPAPPARRQLRR